jgi:long-chain acyl-CoA synthetase
MLNLSVILDDSAFRYPDKTAYIFMETKLSFAQVNAAANQVAGGLSAIGINPGDKVAISCPNLPQFPILYFGIIRAGAIVVPLNVLLKADEVAYHLQDSDAKAYLCFSGSPEFPLGDVGYAGFQKADACEHFFMIMPKPGMRPAGGQQTMDDLMAGQSARFETCATSAEDTCVIIYTSGTTGKAKGAELTHSNLLLNAVMICDLMQGSPDDVAITVLPLFHIFGMTVLMNAGMYKGRTSVLLPRFDPEMTFDAMQKHKVTIFAGVPTMYWGLYNYADPKFDYELIAKNLRLCCSGGAALPVKLLHEFEKRFNVSILEGYGMSEGSPVVTFNQLNAVRKPGSIGKEFWGVDVKLVDEDDSEMPVGTKGELLFRGHNVMKGYYNRPEDTQQALRGGWMHSGDIAVKDEDGFFFIVDRSKDMIIRGGMKIYPREVEELMIQHEAVSLVAVVGTPCEEMGEQVKAFVVLKPGKEIPAEDLIAWTKSRIASYKSPRQVEFVAALPMNATGKILKRELRTS